MKKIYIFYVFFSFSSIFFHDLKTGSDWLVGPIRPSTGAKTGPVHHKTRFYD